MPLGFPTTLVLKVTQQDIDDGRPGGGYSCALALAGIRKLQGARQICEVGVDHFWAYPRPGFVSQYVTYGLSKKAKQFVAAADAGEIVAPATFRLTVMHVEGD